MSANARSVFGDHGRGDIVNRFFAALVLLMSASVHAQDIYMIRSQQSFPEAMTTLQEAIKAKGYTLSRVQRVDIGLTTAGYQTDKYRVVFFGKIDEVREMSDKHLALIPYIPLKIAIFAEGEETVLLAASFRHLKNYFTEPDLLDHFDRWESDIAGILETVRITK